ncbi:MAG: hypothetical protein ACYSTY_12230 [Planctomycetota bacterium]|jgi:hypothetical protein
MKLSPKQEEAAGKIADSENAGLAWSRNEARQLTDSEAAAVLAADSSEMIWDVLAEASQRRAREGPGAAAAEADPEADTVLWEDPEPTAES